MCNRQSTNALHKLVILLISTVIVDLSFAQAVGNDSRLEEIIVTATRRDAAASAVPLSVQALTADEIARLGAVDFADYARNIAGLSFTDAGIGGENQAIRGIVTTATGEVNAATAMYLDEVPITNAGGIGAPYSPKPLLVDVNRVEVLRGPQGTLFGASAMGGAIRIMTEQPDPARRDGFISGAFYSFDGGDDSYDLGGMVNVPLLDGKAAVRAVGYYRDRGGYIDNIASGQENINNQEIGGARLAARVDATDNVSATFRVAWQSRESDGNSIEDLGLPPRTQDRLFENNSDEWVNYALSFDVETSIGSFSSSTSWFDRKVDSRIDISPFLSAVFMLDNQLNVYNQDDTTDFVQEFRLVSSEERPLTWLAGFYWQDQQLDFGQDFPSPGFDALTGGMAAAVGTPDNLFIGRSEFTLEQLALYGELTYQVTGRINVTFGARVFDIERDFQSTNMGLLFAGDPTASGSASESGITPKFSLAYQASDAAYYYVTAAQGYRPGGVNPPEGSSDQLCIQELAALGFSEFPVSYDSDSIWSYEFGGKWRLFSGRAQLNATAYHVDWSDIQINRFLGCGITFIENIGEATTDGVEIDFTSRPTENVVLNAMISYADARLASDLPSAGGKKDDRIPGVPQWTASLGGTVYFPAFSGLEGFVSVDYRYVGESLNGLDPSLSLELPSHSLVDLEIGVAADQWSLALFANNLFDERGVIGIITDVLGAWETATPPLSIGVRGVRRFQ